MLAKAYSDLSCIYFAEKIIRNEGKIGWRTMISLVFDSTNNKKIRLLKILDPSTTFGDSEKIKIDLTLIGIFYKCYDIYVIVEIEP